MPRKKMFFIRLLLFICLLSTPIISWKLTGFIAFYITALYSIFLAFIKIKRFSKTISIAFISPIISIGILISTYIPIAFLQYRKLFPSGHTEERIFSYSTRFHQFYDNFLFGSFFYGYKYLDYGWVKRASHSDIIDFLAMGGVLGFILFVYPFLNALYIGFKNDILFVKKGVNFNNIFTLSILLIFMELSVNPILHQPKLAFFYWMSLAYLLSQYKRKVFL